MNVRHPIVHSLLVVAVLAAVAGCASHREPEFGSSVRHMVQGQEYDPAPATDVVGQVDGEKAAMAIKAYRAEKKQGSGMGTPALIVPGS